MAPIKLLIALVIATIVVVFGAQNTQSVTFHFLMFNVGPAPIVLAVFIAALLGVLIGWLVSVPGRIRGARLQRNLERDVTEANQRTATAMTDLEELRARARSPQGQPQGGD